VFFAVTSANCYRFYCCICIGGFW